MSDAIIVYYSRADENYFNGQLKMLKKGNTEIAAETIRQITGADIFKIEQTQPYSRDYNECIEQARSDLNNNIRPQLVSVPKSLDEYSTIYLGFPNYWGTMPMAVFTFLEHFDLSGKKIMPLCTHEGSGFGNSIKDITRLCPNSVIGKGLAVRGSCAANSEQAIKNWIMEG